MSWTTAHQKKYNWLYNYVFSLKPDLNYNSFIMDLKDELKDIINNNKKWGPSAKEGLYFLVARWFEKNKKSSYSNIYKNLGYKLKIETEHQEEQNQRTEKEKNNNQTMLYFKNLIQKIDYSKIDNIKDHYKYLILNLLTKQAPLRTNFYISAQLLTNKKADDGQTNYIYLNRRGNITASYIVNKDKVSNYKLYKMNNNLKSINIENNDLLQLISDSFKKYPRLFLFEINNQPLTQGQFLQLLRSASEIPGLNVDIMRSIYLTWYYKKYPKLSDQKELSKQMRHTTQTARKNYFKVDEDDDELKNKTNNELIEEIQTLKNNITLLENKLKNFESVETNNDPLFKKRRNDVIYKIRRKGKTPKNATLKKYNINLEEIKNQII